MYIFISAMAEFREDIWQRYLLVSHLLLACAIGHVSLQTTGFYEMSILFLSNKTCMAILYNYAFMVFTLLCRIPVIIFLGRLSTLESEVEIYIYNLNKVQQLQEMTRNYLMDAVIFLVLSKPRLNGRELPIGVLVRYLTVLVALKSFHTLIYVRLSNFFQMDIPSFLSTIRLCSFIYIIAMVDYKLLNMFWSDMNWKNTFTVWFVFEVLGMLLICIFSALRYIVNLLDFYFEEGLKNKTTINFFLELLHDLLSLACFTIFMMIFYIHNPNNMPAYMLIDIIHVMKNLMERVNMLMHYRHMVTVIETRFPKPTVEEREADGTCIICRDLFDDDTRKIECGHIFHMSCLKSWLFQHSTCPTCRAPIQEQLTPQRREIDLSRFLLNIERQVRRRTRRLCAAIQRIIRAYTSSSKEFEGDGDTDFIKRCSTYIMSPVYRKLNRKNLKCEFSIATVVNGDMTRKDAVDVETKPTSSKDNETKGYTADPLDFGPSGHISLAAEEKSSDDIDGIHDCSFVGQDVSGVIGVEEKLKDINFHPTASETVRMEQLPDQLYHVDLPAARTGDPLRDLYNFLRSEGQTASGVGNEVTSAPQSAQAADNGSENGGRATDDVVLHDAEENCKATYDGATAEANERKTTCVNPTAQQSNGNEYTTKSSKSDEPIQQLTLPQWLRSYSHQRSNPNMKTKAGLFKLLKKLKVLKEKLAMLSNDQAKAKSATEVKSNVVTESNSSKTDTGESTVTNKCRPEESIKDTNADDRDSMSARIRQIRIAKLSGKTLAARDSEIPDLREPMYIQETLVVHHEDDDVQSLHGDNVVDYSKQMDDDAIAVSGDGDCTFVTYSLTPGASCRIEIYDNGLSQPLPLSTGNAIRSPEHEDISTQYVLDANGGTVLSVESFPVDDIVGGKSRAATPMVSNETVESGCDEYAHDGLPIDEGEGKHLGIEFQPFTPSMEGQAEIAPTHISYAEVEQKDVVIVQDVSVNGYSNSVDKAMSVQPLDVDVVAELGMLSDSNHPLQDIPIKQDTPTDVNDATDQESAYLPLSESPEPRVVISLGGNDYSSTNVLGQVSTDGSVDTINALLSELSDFEEFDNTDILLEADGATDELLLTKVNSNNLAECHRDLLLTYARLVRMWFLTSEAFSQNDEVLRDVFRTINLRRVSVIPGGIQRKLTTNALSSIECNAVSKEKLKTLHKDFSKRSFTYQDGLWMLGHSTISIDLLDHLVNGMVLIDTIVRSELCNMPN